MGFGFTAAGRERPAADVSVVIPLYNHARYVGAAIESVLDQTLRPREIVCIDDGSTDGSAAVVEAMARRRPFLRFRSRPNQGAHRTLNEAIQEAQGRYVAILNSDDIVALVLALAGEAPTPGACLADQQLLAALREAVR